MKSFRWTYLAIVIVAAMCAAVYFDNKSGVKKAADTEASKNVARIAPVDITRFEIETRVGKVEVEKSGAVWNLIQPIKELGDTEAIESFLSSVGEQRIEQVVARDGEFQTETYGLQDPVATVRLTASDGRKEAIKIGTVKAYDGSLYAQIDQEPAALLVSNRWDVLVSKRAKEFRTKNLFRGSLKMTDVTHLNFDRAHSSLHFEKVSGKWKSEKGDAGFALSQSNFQEALGQIEALKAEEVFDDKRDSKEAMKRTGLAKPDLKISLETDDHKKFAVEFSEMVPEQSKTGKPEIFALSSDSENLTRITSALYNKVNLDAQFFYDRKAPFQLDPKLVTKVQYSANGAQYSFAKVDGVWKETGKGGIQISFDPAKLQGWIDKTPQLEAVRILDERDLKKAYYTSTLEFSSDQALLFKMSWTLPITVKDETQHLDLQVVPVHTSLVTKPIALPEDVMKTFTIENLGETKPVEPAKK